MDVERNLTDLRERIAAAARQAGRDPDEIKLVAVTKTFPPEPILAAYRAGARDFGENRVQEASEKLPQVNAAIPASDPIRWHLIGHLQRRKAPQAVQLFDLIQSVDSVRLAQALSRHAPATGKSLPVLIQVNVARDPNKFGFTAEPRDLFFAQMSEILKLPGVRVRGLMTIGPLVADAEQARPFFRGLRLLREELAAQFPNAEWQELSMGMTDDFQVAVAEGATMLRIGRAIFGERLS